MNERDVIRRIRAYRAGKPLPSGETKRLRIAEDSNLLVVSFVRMGGESRPWGIAFGTPGRRPKILSVPEARNRDLVAGMVSQFAPAILRHLHHPNYERLGVEDWQDLQPLRQVWLANATHLDMLHHLAFAYAWTRFGGPNRDLLNAFGRACGWLFREAQRPGEMCVMLATQALRSAFTFPAEDSRQAHLGFLMAWLKSKGNYQTRLAAAIDAEQHSIATTLDPALEREKLQPLVEEWGSAEKEGAGSRNTRASKTIHSLLEAELKLRWHLTESAICLLRSDPRRENEGIGQLVEETLKEQWYQYIRLEQHKNDSDDGPAYFPSVETDRHPAAAAARYQVYQASAELCDGLLLHDDKELLADSIAAGDAFRGRILQVSDIGTGRTTRPIWKVKDSCNRQLRLRVGSRVSAAGFRQRQGEIRTLESTAEGDLIVEVELTALKTNRVRGPGVHALSPTDTSLIGREVAFVAAPADSISRMKSRRIWAKDGPGAWLTHRNPGGIRASVPQGDSDDVADVRAALEAE